MMFIEDPRERMTEFLRKRNGLLKALIIVFGVATLLTGFIAWDLRQDAKKKDTARDGAVADIKRGAVITDSLGALRYDTLAERLERLERLLSKHAIPLPSAARLDTAKFKEEIYRQQKQELK